MKVLFDTNVPRPLRDRLSGHEITTAQQMAWDTLKNGELLKVAEPLVDVMITTDQNLKYQQNLRERRIAIIVLPTNYLPEVLALAGKVQAALDKIKPGDYVELTR